MVTASLNKTLPAATRDIVIISKPRPTKKKRRVNNSLQQKESITDDNPIMPDFVQKEFSRQNIYSVKNVPLHFSDDERKGLVMPAPTMHQYVDSESPKPSTESKKILKTPPPWPKSQADKEKVRNILSAIFASNSTESPPENILEHFQVSSSSMGPLIKEDSLIRSGVFDKIFCLNHTGLAQAELICSGHV